METVKAKPKWPYMHPIPVHFPQALFPAAFVALLVYLLTGRAEFEASVHVMTLLGLLSTPLTIASGFFDWKIRYRGQLTRVFKIKIVGASVLFMLALATVLLHLRNPALNGLPLDREGWFYFALLAACQVDCVILGYYGGRLVFH